MANRAKFTSSAWTNHMIMEWEENYSSVISSHTEIDRTQRVSSIYVNTLRLLFSRFDASQENGCQNRTIFARFLPILSAPNQCSTFIT